MADRFISTDAPTMTAHDYRLAAARYRLRADATRFPCIRDEWLSLATDCDAIALEMETRLVLA